MAFQPNPVSLKMVASAKGRYVYPTLITWDSPGGLSLVEVRPKDRPGEPLPSEQPFKVTGQQNDGTTSSAWLTLNEREYALWESEFAQRRTLSLKLEVGGKVEELVVKLTHVRLIRADFELILFDAAHAGANALAHLVHTVWLGLRKAVPHRISTPVAQQKQAAPPNVVSTDYDQQTSVAPSILPPPASERRGTAFNTDPGDGYRSGEAGGGGRVTGGR